MELSSALAETISKTWPARAPAWLASYPARLEEVSARWSLRDLKPFANLSYHFVARALRGEEQVVLKLGVPEPEFALEAEALRAFEGRGCVRILDFEPDAAAMLLEDVRPGTSLEETWTEENDDQHTEAIAEALMRLWREPPPDSSFPTLEHWMRVFDEPQPLLPSDLVSAARDLFGELNRDCELKLLHGDPHHGNLLRAETGFKAIDPKGVIGDPAFEVYGLLRNPIQASESQKAGLLERRLEIVSEVTGIGVKRLRSWGFLGCVLSACWTAEDGLTVPSGSITLARILNR